MKKTLLSPLCSGLVIPGLGQVLNRQLKKGLILLVGIFVVFIGLVIQLYKFLIFVLDRLNEYPLNPEGILKAFADYDTTKIYVAAIIFMAIWLYSVLDALIYGIKLDRQEKAAADESLPD